MTLRRENVAIRSAEAKIDGQDADVAVQLMEAKMRRLKVIAAVITSLSATIAGIISAAVASHH